MKREASPPMKRENPTPGLVFSGLSAQSTRMTFPDFEVVAKMSDKPTLSDILLRETGAAGYGVKWPVKRRHGEAGGSQFTPSRGVSTGITPGGNGPWVAATLKVSAARSPAPPSVRLAARPAFGPRSPNRQSRSAHPPKWRVAWRRLASSAAPFNGGGKRQQWRRRAQTARLVGGARPDTRGRDHRFATKFNLYSWFGQ
jgi:hypothetical protein